MEMAGVIPPFYSRYNEGIEIDTREDHRRKDLALFHILLHLPS